MSFFNSLKIERNSDNSALFLFDLEYLLDCLNEANELQAVPEYDIESWARDQIALLYKTQNEYFSIEIEKYISCYDVAKYLGEGVLVCFSSTVH